VVVAATGAAAQLQQAWLKSSGIKPRPSMAQPLSVRDQAIAADLGPQLAARGLLLVGLDVIGDCLTEVNVTSPTCFREIMDQTGFDVAAMFVDALEQALA
jgi:glutathione synthase